MMANFWDKRAAKYDELVRKHDVDFQNTINRARSLLSASDVVLDLGCASGEYGLDIAPFVKSVHGIDTSANMIALATRKANERSIGNVTFSAIDVFDRSLDARRFTAVLAFSVLHLVEELRPILARVNGLLTTGGLFISQTPCIDEWGFPLRLLVRMARRVKAMPPILSFTARELDAAIAAAGFDIAESRAWDSQKAIRWVVTRKR